MASDPVSNNAKYEFFDKISSKTKTQSCSVIKQFFDQQYNVASYYSSGHPLNVFGDSKTVAAGANTKPYRIADYRQISNYAEVGDAVEEIADAHITKHTDGSFVKASIIGIELTETTKKEIEEQCEQYFGLFSFEDNIFEYARKLTVEGELCWENIIDGDNKSLGFIDVRYIPNETYEFAYDIKERRKTGIAVYNDIAASDPSVMETKHHSGIGYQGSNTTSLNCYSQISAGRVIYLPFEQVTYINSGIYDGTGLIVYPALERARRAYNQLQLIEDAVLVYRLVRAPVRNVFTVDCGKMNPTKAQQHVRNLAQSMSSKKTYDPATGTIAGTYDPFNIMENVWIPKTSEADGVQISSIGGEAKWGELDDLNYFLRKLYRALKVPASRFLPGSSGEGGEGNYQHTDEISYEEYRFAKYIFRSLSCFARGLKDGLANHLKLVGLWDSAGLSLQNLRISIAPPVELEIYRSQKLLQMQAETYQSYVSNDEISKRWAQKRILNMSESDISENARMKKEEMISAALFEAELEKMKSDGRARLSPADKNLNVPPEDVDDENKNEPIENQTEEEVEGIADDDSKTEAPLPGLELPD